jgi:hypothetical protein
MPTPQIFTLISGGIPQPNPSGGYTYKYTDVIAANPNAGLPTSAAVYATINLTYLGFYPLTPASPPAYNSLTQAPPVETIPVFTTVWTQTWANPVALTAAGLAGVLNAVLQQGLVVTSTANQATLGGTYACTAAAMAYVAIASLPTATAIFKFPDQSGTLHTFSAVQFATLSKVLRDYHVAVNSVASANTAGTLTAYPVNTATIP